MASPIGEDRAGAFDARNLDYEVDGARLLSSVALEGHPGELIGLIGPNGAGKSTLLRVLAGIVRRSGGEVLIEGLDLNAIPPREMARRLALVSQHAPETYGFTALEIVLTGRYPHLGRLEIEGAEDEAIALDAMRLTDAEPFSARVASSLSGGERQRVFLARALAQEPRILLLDEPTASLDVRHQMAIFDLVRQLTRTRQLTAVAAVHDLRLAARYCDRLVLMHHSRVVADGPAEAVLTREHLADVFGVRALVYREPFGGLLSVDFHPGPPDGGSRHAGRVHVAAGATGVAGLLHQLVGVGFEVSAEGLADGSLDRFVADALGVSIVSGASVPDAFVVCAGNAGRHDSGGAHFRCRDMSGDGRCLAETEEEVVAEACRRIGAEGCTEHARVGP